MFNSDFDITDHAALRALYGEVGEASRTKETDRLDANYRALIAASPFCALATAGLDGLDCSPRGDAGQLVDIIDDRTLVLPDRRGNNRIDSLANLVHDPRLALLFMIPGVNETLRVNGRGRLNADPAMLARYAVNSQLPKLLLIIEIESVFFQCARALVRSALWDPARQVARSSLPSAGQILAGRQQGFDGAAYDAALPARQQATLY
jgi:PPOX class probable FMN-dependent enzyme